MPIGVYTALPDPLAAFAADVKYAASLYQAACNKAHSLFAQEYLDKCEWGVGGRGRRGCTGMLGVGCNCLNPPAVSCVLPAPFPLHLPLEWRYYCSLPCSSLAYPCSRPRAGRAGGEQAGAGAEGD